jgi:hypothetical protein
MSRPSREVLTLFPKPCFRTSWNEPATTRPQQVQTGPSDAAACPSTWAPVGGQQEGFAPNTGKHRRLWQMRLVWAPLPLWQIAFGLGTGSPGGSRGWFVHHSRWWQSRLVRAACRSLDRCEFCARL